MGRKNKLALMVGKPEHFEACMLCAQIDWLGKTTRVFHRRIEKKENELYKVWLKKSITAKDYEWCCRAEQRWRESFPRISQELHKRLDRLRARYEQWRETRKRIQKWLKKRKFPVRPITDKITGIAKKIDLYEELIRKMPLKTRQFKDDMEEYRRMIRKESSNYIRNNFPFPMHLRHEERLNKQLTDWHNGHPVCSRCGLRFGGFHLGKPHFAEIDNNGEPTSGVQICQFCLREQRFQPKWFTLDE